MKEEDKKWVRAVFINNLIGWMDGRDAETLWDRLGDEVIDDLVDTCDGDINSENVNISMRRVFMAHLAIEQ